MDVVQNNEDVCIHDDDVKSFQSWTTLNENKQENLKSYSPQPDENAQSGQTLTENGNTLVSDSSSGTTRKSDNPSLIFSNYFKNINQYQSDEVEGKKSSSNQMNENCNLMSQTQLVSTQLYESDLDLFEEDETEEKEILQGNYHSESDDSSLNPLIRSNRKVNRIDSSSVSSPSNESRASIKSHGDDLIAGDHLLLQTGSNVQNEVAENDCEKKFIDCDLGNDSKSLFTKDNETNDDFCKETDDLSKSNVVEAELLESEILQDKISTGKLKLTKRGLAKYSSQENSNNSLQNENVNNNFLDDTIKYTSKRNRNSFSSGSVVNINPRTEELHQSPNEKQSNEIPKDEIEHTSPKVEKVQNSTSLITNQTSNIATTEKKTKLNSQEIEHVESKGDDMSQDVLPPTPTNQSQFSNNFRDGNIEGSWESFPLTEIEALENEFTKSRQLQQQTHQSPTEDLKNTGSSTAKIKKSLSDVFNSNNKNSDIKSDSTIVIKNARDDSLSGIEEMIDSRTCQTSNSNSQECLEGDLSKVIVNAEADVAIGNKNVIEDEESNIKKNMEKSTENRLLNAEESEKYKFEITKVESEVLEVDRRSGKSSGGISQQICIVASGLSPSELRIIIDFTKKIQAEFHPKFNKHTTHVVVKTDESRLCQRTLKYFQGMAAGIWVVSYKWILNSLRTGNILPEEDFEVTGDMVHGIHYGPQKSRTSKIKLLRDYEICCMGEFQELSREDLVDLAEQFGATTVLDPSMFPFQSKMRIIIVQLFKEQKKIQDMCTKYQVMAITRDWLLDSMTNHECLPYDNYRYIKPRETKKV